MVLEIDGDAVRSRRQNLADGPSQKIFAKRIKISHVTLNKIEKGKTGASREMIEKIARGLKCRPDEISKDPARGLLVRDAAAASGLSPHNIPNLGTLSMSRFSFSFDMPPDNYLPFQILGRPGEQYAAFTGSGDCMEPTIDDGDEVIVRATTRVEDGAIAVVYYDGECTLKRVYRRPNGVELVADNKKYPPKTIASNKVEIRAEVWRVLKNPRKKKI